MANDDLSPDQIVGVFKPEIIRDVALSPPHCKGFGGKILIEKHPSSDSVDLVGVEQGIEELIEGVEGGAATWSLGLEASSDSTIQLVLKVPKHLATSMES